MAATKATVKSVEWSDENPKTVNVVIQVTEDAVKRFSVNTDNPEHQKNITREMAALERDWAAFIEIVEAFKPEEVIGVDDKDSQREIDEKRRREDVEVKSAFPPAITFKGVPVIYDNDLLVEPIVLKKRGRPRKVSE